MGNWQPDCSYQARPSYFMMDASLEKQTELPLNGAVMAAHHLVQ
jgi:hypothetical protein